MIKIVKNQITRFCNLFKAVGVQPDNLGPFLIASIFINLLALALPLMLLQVYDRIIPHASAHTLVVLVAIVLGATAFELTLRFMRSKLIAWADARFIYKTSLNAFDKILNTSIPEFERDGVGTQLERLNSLNSMKDFYGGQALTTIVDMPFVVMYLGLIAYLAGYLMLVPLTLLVAFTLLALSNGEELKKSLSYRRNADDRRLNFIIEVLSGIHTVKSMAMETLMKRRYERLQKSNAVSDYDISMKSSMLQSANNFITQLNMIFIVTFGSILVIHNHLTLGGLAACTLLANRCLAPLGKAMMVWRRLQSIKLAEDRLDSIMALTPECNNDKENLETFTKGILFDNVSFSYPGHDKVILKNIRFEMPINQTVSLSGDAVGGKSTLLMLLMGVLSPSKGQVLIDDRPFTSLNLASWRKHISYVPHEGFLFDGTVLENLTTFRNKEYVERAIEVCDWLGLSEVINQFPEGIETRVGNRTVDFLPIGIQQLIALARALVDDNPIIIFDEANTALDKQANLQVVKLLNELKGRKTLLIVSHQQSLINLAQTQYFLENGHLLEKQNEHASV